MADMAIRSRLRQLPRTLSQLGGSVSSASGPPGPARLDPASPWRAAGDPGRPCAVAPSAPVGCDRSRRHTRRPAFCRTARPSLCLGHSGAQTVGPAQAWPRAFARGPALHSAIASLPCSRPRRGGRRPARSFRDFDASLEARHGCSGCLASLSGRARSRRRETANFIAPCATGATDVAAAERADRRGEACRWPRSGYSIRGNLLLQCGPPC